jgi:hypothetical protein
MPVQHGLEVGAERAFGEWLTRLTFGGGWSTAAAERASISQRDLRMSASATWTFPVSVAMGGVGLEVRPRVIWQHIGRSAEVDRLYGTGLVQTALVIAAGPLVTASIPLGDRSTLGFDLGAGMEWAPDQQGNVRARAFAQARVVGGWAF